MLPGAEGKKRILFPRELSMRMPSAFLILSKLNITIQQCQAENAGDRFMCLRASCAQQANTSALPKQRLATSKSTCNPQVLLQKFDQTLYPA